ncbi:sigma-70 family RNA polymerase sigma factor [Acidicapsa ligni]|uniref:sigma-70 family RNA polymerase sigma factor n=1 Tax=Acidicapsa ligni TaxID=542300 RepID=UPI0021E0B2A4|nr:sigma-70 family RNA polymerase sigma factor [Acidicapsa ligni]
MRYASQCEVANDSVTALDSTIGAIGEFEHQAEVGPEFALIRRVRLGDPRAFELLLEPHKKRLERTVFQIVRNSHDVEDIVQQCSLKIFTKLEQFQGRSQFSTWITRIAINQSLMHLRKTKTQPILIEGPMRDEGSHTFPDPTDSSFTPEEAYLSTELVHLLWKHIDRLPESRRIVLRKLYGEELSMEQTARILGITLAAAKSRALRARRDLRKIFAGQAAHRGLAGSSYSGS